MSRRLTSRHPSSLWLSEPALILLLVLYSLTCVFSAEPAATAIVEVSPSSIVAYTGQDFNIDIIVTDVTDLYGWEFRLAWNPTLLNAISAAEGQFLYSHGSTYFSYNVDSSTGRMVADCTLLGEVFGVSGSGILATVTFHVKSPGECLLDLYNVTLLSHLEQTIQCQASDASGTFMDPHDVAVTDVEASPLTAMPSAIVKVNVTVWNEGGYTEDFNVTAYANATLIGGQYVSLASGISTVVQFDWDTAGFLKGEYVISGQASIVPDETGTSDNSGTANDKVTVLYAGHDIAIINVKPVKTAVGQGYMEIIEVTVKNYGTFTEMLNTTAYVNVTGLVPQTATLASGSSATLSFTWDTTDSAIATYATSAQTTVVPGETYTADNAMDGQSFVVTIPGDVNGNFRVEIFDVVKITSCYNKKQGDALYDPSADIDGNGVIGILDVVLCTSHYGQEWP